MALPANASPGLGTRNSCGLVREPQESSDGRKPSRRSRMPLTTYPSLSVMSLPDSVPTIEPEMEESPPGNDDAGNHAAQSRTKPCSWLHKPSVEDMRRWFEAGSRSRKRASAGPECCAAHQRPPSCRRSEAALSSPPSEPRHQPVDVQDEGRRSPVQNKITRKSVTFMTINSESDSGGCEPGQRIKLTKAVPSNVGDKDEIRRGPNSLLNPVSPTVADDERRFKRGPKTSTRSRIEGDHDSSETSMRGLSNEEAATPMRKSQSSVTDNFDQSIAQDYTECQKDHEINATPSVADLRKLFDKCQKSTAQSRLRARLKPRGLSVTSWRNKHQENQNVPLQHHNATTPRPSRKKIDSPPKLVPRYDQPRRKLSVGWEATLKERINKLKIAEVSPSESIVGSTKSLRPAKTEANHGSRTNPAKPGVEHAAGGAIKRKSACGRRLWERISESWDKTKSDTRNLSHEGELNRYIKADKFKDETGDHRHGPFRNIRANGRSLLSSKTLGSTKPHSES